MNYLKLFENFVKPKFISDIIDHEIEKSKGFGLNISEDDIKLEKQVFVQVFEYLWDNIVECRSNSEYAELLEMARYHIDKKINMNNKCNNYASHIEDLINILFQKIYHNKQLNLK